jgi:hypothetical protein
MDDDERAPLSGGATITTFRKKYGIAHGTFYEARKRGETPDELRIGRKVIITPDAERAWIVRQTRPTRPPTEAQLPLAEAGRESEAEIEAEAQADAEAHFEAEAAASRPRAAKTTGKRTARRTAKT